MMGKVLVVILALVALVGGVTMWWLQVYAFYEDVDAAEVRLTTPEGDARTIDATGAEAIDAASSPIRYRACFTSPAGPEALAGEFATYADPVPLVAPGWFDCFDADAIAAALETGAARAFLSESNVEYGIDRVAAVFDDGRGVVWPQLNRCGRAVYDGLPEPEGCPPAPERLK